MNESEFRLGVSQPESRPTIPLELITQGKLHNARIACGGDFAKGCGCVVKVAVGLTEVCVVQGIEELRAELHHPEVFGDGDASHEREIYVRETGAAKDVPTGVAVGTRQVGGECGGVEVARDLVSLVEIRRAVGSPDYVGPIEVDSGKRGITASDHGKGITARELDEAVDRPV